jgi:hypothetical protein
MNIARPMNRKAGACTGKQRDQGTYRYPGRIAFAFQFLFASVADANRECIAKCAHREPHFAPALRLRRWIPMVAGQGSSRNGAGSEITQGTPPALFLAPVAASNFTFNSASQPA